MFDEHLFTWALGTIYTHIQDVVPYKQWVTGYSKLMTLFSNFIS
jgi:hypothetical protein